jgi:hypothetical protein
MSDSELSDIVSVDFSPGSVYCSNLVGLCFMRVINFVHPLAEFSRDDLTYPPFQAIPFEGSLPSLGSALHPLVDLAQEFMWRSPRTGNREVFRLSASGLPMTFQLSGTEIAAELRNSVRARPRHTSARSTTSCAARMNGRAMSVQTILLMNGGSIQIGSGGIGT